MTIEEYLQNPCGVSSLPYWKAQRLSTPDGMMILHDKEFDASFLKSYDDEPYFRLMHTLKSINNAPLPEQFSFFTPSADELAAHINSCYEILRISCEDLQAAYNHPTYSPDLWLAINDNIAEQIVATGIAELDPMTNEGILEWIQVSRDYRRRGLGACVVTELLRRMKGRVSFVTVSGKVDNPSNPESLYRKCGFSGNDIWHILTKK